MGRCTAGAGGKPALSDAGHAPAAPSNDTCAALATLVCMVKQVSSRKIWVSTSVRALQVDTSRASVPAGTSKRMSTSPLAWPKNERLWLFRASAEPMPKVAAVTGSGTWQVPPQYPQLQVQVWSA